MKISHPQCILALTAASCVLLASCGTKNIPSTVITGSAVSSVVSPSSVFSDISRSEPVSSQLVSSAASSKNPAVSSQKTEASLKSHKVSPTLSVSSEQITSYPGKPAKWVADMCEWDAYARKQPDVQKFTSLLKRAPDEIDWQHDGKQLVFKPGDKAFSELFHLNSSRCTNWLNQLSLFVKLNKPGSKYADINVLLYRYNADGDTVYFLLDRKTESEGNDVFLEGKDKGTSIYQYYQPDLDSTNQLIGYLNSISVK